MRKQLLAQYGTVGFCVFNYTYNFVSVNYTPFAIRSLNQLNVMWKEATFRSDPPKVLQRDIMWCMWERQHSSILMFGTSEKLFVDCWNHTVSTVPEINKLTSATGNSSGTDLADSEVCLERKRFLIFLTGWKNVFINLPHVKRNRLFSVVCRGCSAWVRNKGVNCTFTHVLIQGLSISAS